MENNENKPKQEANLKISKEEYDNLKAKHKHIYIIDIDLGEGEKYQFIAKRPSKDTMSAVAASKTDLDHANTLLINGTIIAGDKEYLDDGIVYTCLLKELAGIFKLGKTSFTKA